MNAQNSDFEFVASDDSSHPRSSLGGARTAVHASNNSALGLRIRTAPLAILCLATLVQVLVPSFGHGQGTIIVPSPFGPLPDETCWVISDDGSTVGGSTWNKAAIWTSNGALLLNATDIPDGQVECFSYDGTVAFGTIVGPANQIFRWTATGGMQRLDTPANLGPFVVGSMFCSQDGQVLVVNLGFTDHGELWTWSATAGFQSLGTPLTTTQFILVSACSADASVLTGLAFDPGSVFSGRQGQVWRWSSASGFQILAQSSDPFPFSSPLLSADGGVVVWISPNDGTGVAQTFRWSAGTLTTLSGSPGGTLIAASDLSADGSTAVGLADGPQGVQVFRWTPGGGFQGLGFPVAGVPGSYPSLSVVAVDPDGSDLIGTWFSSGGGTGLRFTWRAAGGYEVSDNLPPLGQRPAYWLGDRILSRDRTAFCAGNQGPGWFWSVSTGAARLQTAPGHHSTVVTAVSGDGRVVIGSVQDENYQWHGYRWTPSSGFTWFTDPTTGEPLLPDRITPDGKTIVGVRLTNVPELGGFSPEPWRWTQGTGVQLLGIVPNGVYYGYNSFDAECFISDDASTIAGLTEDADGNERAFLWDSSDGFISVDAYVGPTADVSFVPGSGLAFYGSDPNTPNVLWRVPYAKGSPSTSSADWSVNAGGGDQLTLVTTRPIIETLTPAQVTAGLGNLIVTVYGLGFESGSTVSFGSTAVPTTVISSTQLTAAVPSSALPGSADFATVQVTVFGPAGDLSNPAAFTVVGSGVGTSVSQVQSGVAAAGQTATVQAAPSDSTSAGVSASLQNTDGTTPATVTAATYTQNPTPAPAFESGGGFVDLQVSGAGPGAQLTSSFYYPKTATGAVETALTLKFYNGSQWVTVLSSGGVPPVKNTTDNLDGTVSGGRFTVVFDNTSTPAITALSGTVFAVAVPDTTPPQIACANVTVSCALGLTVPVTYPALTVSDNVDPAPKVTYSIPSGSGFPVGTTTVTATATDAARNSSHTTFTVTRASLQFAGFLSPIGGADSTGGSFAAPLRTFKAGSTIPIKFTAQCGGTAITTGVHRLQAIKYTNATTAGTPIDATPQGGATTGDEFQYSSGQWQFNLDTKATGMTTGIWLLQATLSDGSLHSVWVQLK